jgi:hypothetical protein
MISDHPSDNFTVISNDNKTLIFDKKIFFCWKIYDHICSDNTTIFINLPISIIYLAYSVLLSLDIGSIPIIFPIKFEEFFIFCDFLGIPKSLKIKYMHQLYDNYRNGWYNYLYYYIYRQMNFKGDFYDHHILYSKICDNILSFKNHLLSKVIFQYFLIFFSGITTGILSILFINNKH